MSSKFKVQSRWSVSGKTKALALLLWLSLFTVYYSTFTVSAHEGEDHSADKKTETKTAPVTGAKITSVTAERNVQTDAGQFNVQLTRTPSDPRTGESAQFVVRLSEKVEGGFGGSEPAPLENAIVTANITKGGANIAENVAAKHEGGNAYRLAYAFQNAGDYKVLFNVATGDNRNFSTDFPVSVGRAPMNWTFWVGLAILSLLTLGALGFVFAKSKDANGKRHLGRAAPFAVAAILFFALGTFALAYFAPPRQARVITADTTSETTPAAPQITDALTSTVTIPKESQILFGIKTQPVEIRLITSGLKVTGTVRARPDARAVVVPPVAGRIVLKQGLSIGSAVASGEQIGTVEQILDVSGQTELESQRLEVEAQQREVESKRLEIRNTVLQLQGQQAEQRANANQARTQLAQAQRELRRSENLLEVGAVPRKRVEEAQTAVKVAQQSVASAEQQVRLLENQIKQTNAGQNIFRAPRVNQPTRSFPLVAPITGIINEIKATSGQQVETGTELLSISNLSTVLIEANVFERDLPIVRESTRASFTSAALSGEVYTIGTRDGDGRLVSVGQAVNAETRAVPVIYEVINPLGRLREGNFVEITIDTSGDQKVLAVPKSAVVREQGQTFVYVLTGGETFERRTVALGAEGADFYEVKTGLKESDRVVVEGVYQLRTTTPSA
jgi:multidrug efflux pump subunit AcrA (membrane-fusion protein)